MVKNCWYHHQRWEDDCFLFPAQHMCLADTDCRCVCQKASTDGKFWIRKRPQNGKSKPGNGGGHVYTLRKNSLACLNQFFRNRVLRQCLDKTHESISHCWADVPLTSFTRDWTFVANHLRITGRTLSQSLSNHHPRCPISSKLVLLLPPEFGHCEFSSDWTVRVVQAMMINYQI